MEKNRGALDLASRAGEERRTDPLGVEARGRREAFAARRELYRHAVSGVAGEINIARNYLLPKP